MASDQQAPCHEYDDAVEKLKDIRDELEAAEQEFREASERLEAARLSLETTRKSHDDAENVVRQYAEDNLDALLSRPTAWNATYRRLEAFKQQRGHCDVRRNVVNKKEQAKMDPEEKALGCFVGKCRADARRPLGHPDRLEGYKKAALDRLGFHWDPHMKRWMEKYEDFKAYKQQHGDCDLSGLNSDLVAWVYRQKKQYRLLQKGEKSEMTPDRIALLNELSFDWNVHIKNLKLRESKENKEEQAWDEFYSKLKDFHRIHGHTIVPKNDKTFYQWVQYQRVHMRRVEESKENNLSEDQVKRLRAIHFYYGRDSNDVQWMNMYLQLRAYYSLFGTLVITDDNCKHKYLAKWVARQRCHLMSWIVYGNKEGMADERATLLQGLGLDSSETSEVVGKDVTTIAGGTSTPPILDVSIPRLPDGTFGFFIQPNANGDAYVVASLKQPLVQYGDKILFVNGTKTAGMPFDEVVRRVRGTPPGEKLQMKLQRFCVATTDLPGSNVNCFGSKRKEIKTPTGLPDIRNDGLGAKRKEQKNISDLSEMQKESRGVETKKGDKPPMEKEASPVIGPSQPRKRQKVSLKRPETLG